MDGYNFYQREEEMETFIELNWESRPKGSTKSFNLLAQNNWSPFITIETTIVLDCEAQGGKG